MNPLTTPGTWVVSTGAVAPDGTLIITASRQEVAPGTIGQVTRLAAPMPEQRGENGYVYGVSVLVTGPRDAADTAIKMIVAAYPDDFEDTVAEDIAGATGSTRAQA